MCDSMNKLEIFVKKSSIDARAGRQGVPYCVGPITMEMDKVITSTKRR